MKSQTRRTWRRGAAVIAAFAFVAAACGSDDEAKPTTTQAVDDAAPSDDSAPAETGTPADDAEPADGTEPTTTEASPAEEITPVADEEPTGPQGPLGGNLVVGYVSTVNGLGPHPFGATTFPYRDALYDPLVYLDAAGEPQPALAESWELSDDGLTLTMHLRDSVTYHDGTPFDADAVVANIAWFATPELGLQGTATWAAMTATAIDASTVELAFAAPVPEIFSLLDVALLSKPGDFEAGIGTGAFMLESFTPRTGLELTANPDYWGEGPYVDSVTLREFADSSAAELAAQAGDLDLLLSVQAPQVATLEGAGLVIEGSPGAGNFDILVNSTEAGITDARVRRALSLAFDRERFVDTILLGLGTPVSSIFPPASPVHSGEAPEVTPFDLDAAKALIDEAGASGLTIDIMSPPILPTDQFLPIYQADLASIGVTLNIVPTDPGAWAGAVATPGAIPDLATHAYGFGDSDPALLFGAHPFRPGSNASGFESADYEAMVAAASAQTDLAARYAAFKAIDEFVTEEAFVFPIANALALRARQPYVAGLFTLRQRIDLSGVTVDK